MARIVLTYLAALAGVALFRLAGLPLPWLLGPLLACLVAALAGARLQAADPVTATMRTVLGIAVGTAITPALFGALPQMLASLALMPVFVIVIGCIGYPFFRRVFGFDPPTAYYSAMPGGLQDMLAFGEEAGGDVRALSLIHATRVLIVVTLLPFIFAFWMGVDMTRPPGAPVSAIPPAELLLMVAAGLGGWWAAVRAGMFGASILGPMLAVGALSLTGLIAHRPPAEAIQAAQFFLGTGIGVSYSGITWRELRIDVAAGVAYTLLVLVIAAGFAQVAVGSGLVPGVEGLLIFSPGGQAEMAILAIVAGADVAMVVAHHVTRMVVVILGAPLVARGVLRK